jgi:hypothetical protein
MYSCIYIIEAYMKPNDVWYILNWKSSYDVTLFMCQSQIFKLVCSCWENFIRIVITVLYLKSCQCQLWIWRLQISVLTAFATIKSTIDTSNSSNTLTVISVKWRCYTKDRAYANLYFISNYKVHTDTGLNLNSFTGTMYLGFVPAITPIKFKVQQSCDYCKIVLLRTTEPSVLDKLKSTIFWTVW